VKNDVLLQDLVHASGEGRYDALSNNCIDAKDRLLKASGIDTNYGKKVWEKAL
jgi:hypothetical protein